MLDAKQRFVEICNTAGVVVAVVFVNNRDSVQVITAEDFEFGRYKKMFGVSGATIKNI